MSLKWCWEIWRGTVTSAYSTLLAISKQWHRTHTMHAHKHTHTHNWIIKEWTVDWKLGGNFCRNPRCMLHVHQSMQVWLEVHPLAVCIYDTVVSNKLSHIPILNCLQPLFPCVNYLNVKSTGKTDVGCRRKVQVIFKLSCLGMAWWLYMPNVRSWAVGSVYVFYSQHCSEVDCKTTCHTFPLYTKCGHGVGWCLRSYQFVHSFTRITLGY